MNGDLEEGLDKIVIEENKWIEGGDNIKDKILGRIVKERKNMKIDDWEGKKKIEYMVKKKRMMGEGERMLKKSMKIKERKEGKEMRNIIDLKIERWRIKKIKKKKRKNKMKGEGIEGSEVGVRNKKWKV